MATDNPASRSFFIPETAALTDEELASLSNSGIKIPNGAAIHFVNLRAMWRHSPHRFIRCSVYAQAWGIAEKTVSRVVKAIAAAEGKTAITAYENGRKAGLRIVSGNPRQTSGSDAVVERYANACNVHTTHIPNGPEVTSNGPRSVSSTDQGPLVQRSTVRSIDEGINDQIDKSINKELSRSASAERPTDRSREKEFFEQAATAAIKEQARLSGRQHHAPSADAIDGLLAIAADQHLSFDDIQQRICNCLSWAASQHWLNERPTPFNIGNSFAQHLRGEYPEPPSTEWEPGRTRPDCHSETVCDVVYADGQFVVYDASEADTCAFGIIGDHQWQPSPERTLLARLPQVQTQPEPKPTPEPPKPVKRTNPCDTRVATPTPDALLPLIQPTTTQPPESESARFERLKRQALNQAQQLEQSGSASRYGIPA
ncbi:hypothetical protein MITS9509_00978 [Synechococcus sp. MIT S9509]|uniref:hypothetical protein n=1 Tax=Synechococcus sp. MIT S9509 TaxID=1801630 RepID=UPI0007BB0EEA|nr:hypothetical protein [Synechococcus sp. MIT S9509]KZR93101.1 hypothetical protein MITS9509_00978 [Synechococcus sp. MIT S9509]